MEISTFDYILKRIEYRSEKQSNFRICITPTEKLIITLRKTLVLSFLYKYIEYKYSVCVYN